jgi:hypothetical protein
MSPKAHLLRIGIFLLLGALTFIACATAGAIRNLGPSALENSVVMLTHPPDSPARVLVDLQGCRRTRPVGRGLVGILVRTRALVSSRRTHLADDLASHCIRIAFFSAGQYTRISKSATRSPK